MRTGSRGGAAYSAADRLMWLDDMPYVVWIIFWGMAFFAFLIRVRTAKIKQTWKVGTN